MTQKNWVIFINPLNHNLRQFILQSDFSLPLNTLLKLIKLMPNKYIIANFLLKYSILHLKAPAK